MSANMCGLKATIFFYWFLPLWFSSSVGLLGCCTIFEKSVILTLVRFKYFYLSYIPYQFILRCFSSFIVFYLKNIYGEEYMFVNTFLSAIETWAMKVYFFYFVYMSIIPREINKYVNIFFVLLLCLTDAFCQNASFNVFCM